MSEMKKETNQDVKLCEYDYWLDRAENILDSIQNNCNPAYLKTRVVKYFRDKRRNNG